MSCYKTGAHIFLAPYNAWAVCDVFEFGDQFLFRITHVDFDPNRPIRDVLHFTVDGVGHWFDKGAQVSTLITSKAFCTYHGYDGVNLPEAEKTA